MESQLTNNGKFLVMTEFEFPVQMRIFGVARRPYPFASFRWVWYPMGRNAQLNNAAGIGQFPDS